MADSPGVRRLHPRLRVFRRRSRRQRGEIGCDDDDGVCAAGVRHDSRRAAAPALAASAPDVGALPQRDRGAEAKARQAPEVRRTAPADASFVNVLVELFRTV